MRPSQKKQKKKSSAKSRQHEMKFDEVVTTVPTIDSNVGTVERQIRKEDHWLLERGPV